MEVCVWGISGKYCREYMRHMLCVMIICYTLVIWRSYRVMVVLIFKLGEQIPTHLGCVGPLIFTIMKL